MPQTSSARARPRVRSMPMRFASAGVSGENGEQDQRQRVDQAGGGGGQRQLLLDLLQQRADAGQGSAQVGRDQHNADDQQDRAV